MFFCHHLVLPFPHRSLSSHVTLFCPQPTTTTAMPDMVMQGVYDDMKAAKEDYQIATGVLGVLCGFFILLFIIVYIRKRRKLMDVV